MEKYNRLVNEYYEETEKMEKIRCQGGNTQEQERVKRELERKMEQKKKRTPSINWGDKALMFL